MMSFFKKNKDPSTTNKNKKEKINDFLIPYIESFENDKIYFLEYLKSIEAIDTLLSKFDNNSNIFSTLFIHYIIDSQFKYFLSCFIEHKQKLKISKLKITIPLDQFDNIYNLISISNCVEHLDLSICLIGLYCIKKYTEKKIYNIKNYSALQN